MIVNDLRNLIDTHDGDFATYTVILEVNGKEAEITALEYDLKGGIVIIKGEGRGK